MHLKQMFLAVLAVSVVCLLRSASAMPADGYDEFDEMVDEPQERTFGLASGLFRGTRRLASNLAHSIGNFVYRDPVVVLPSYGHRPHYGYGYGIDDGFY